MRLPHSGQTPEILAVRSYPQRAQWPLTTAFRRYSSTPATIMNAGALSSSVGMRISDKSSDNPNVNIADARQYRRPFGTEESSGEDVISRKSLGMRARS